MHEINCWNCGNRLGVAPQQSGQEVTCPGCSSRITVPRELFEQNTPRFSTPAMMYPPERFEPRFPMLTASIVLTPLALIAGLAMNAASEEPIVLVFTLPIILAAACTWLVFHQKLWSLVPEHRRTTSPARAAWFLLIPFFNWYWTFRSCIPIQMHLNTILDERRIPGVRASIGLAIAYSVTMVGNALIGLIASAFSQEAAISLELLLGLVEFVLWLLMVLNQKQVARQILMASVPRSVAHETVSA